MLLRTKLEIAGALAALVVIALVISSAREARRDAAALKATLATQGKVIATATKDEAVRDKAAEKTVAALETTRKRVQTPAQALKALPMAIPLPLPLIVVPPRQESQGPISSKAPGSLPETPVPAPGDAIIPAKDLKPLYDFGVACQECQVKLDAATKDRADDQKKLTALAEERDAAITASKGGRLWTRIKRNGKWLLVGIGVGAAAGAVAARR
jgi:hypothetical protein